MDIALKDHIINLAKLFPWYQSLIDSIDLSKTELCELPVIDQHLLAKYYYNRSNYFSDAMTYYTSGTSSGMRKRIYYSPNDHRAYLSHRKEIFKRYITPECKVACSDLGTGHAADSAMYIFNELGLRTYKIDYTIPLDQHINILNNVQPDVFFVMPMILDKLIQTKNLKIHPKKIFLVGDIATKIWQKNIADYFNIKITSIIDLLGSIEVGSIAFFNHDIGLYQIEEHIIPEIIHLPNDGLPVLVLTSTARNYFPAIRFNTHDMVENLHSIQFNDRQIWVFERCLGRIGEEFKAGEKISFYDLLACVEKNLPKIPFNVIEHQYQVQLLLPASKVTPEQVDNLKIALRRVNPDIDAMITSGLTPDFIVNCVDDSKLDGNHFKRKILKIK